MKGGKVEKTTAASESDQRMKDITVENWPDKSIYIESADIY